MNRFEFLFKMAAFLRMSFSTLLVSLAIQSRIIDKYCFCIDSSHRSIMVFIRNFKLCNVYEIWEQGSLFEATYTCIVSQSPFTAQSGFIHFSPARPIGRLLDKKTENEVFLQKN